MKQTPLIFSIIALVAVAALGIIQLTSNDNGKKKATSGEAVQTTAQAGSIVWFDLDRVLDEYDMANDLRTVVETKVQSIQEEINRRGNKLQSDANKFQSDLNKGLLVRSVAEQRNIKLQEQQNNFNEEHQYAMIIATQGSVLPAPVATGDPDLDVTDAIISGLNDEYVQSKGKGSKPAATDGSKAE